LGVGFGVGLGVGFGVGFGVGLGVGFGVGLGVGFGVGFGVGWGVGLGVGLGVGRGVGYANQRKQKLFVSGRTRTIGFVRVHNLQLMIFISTNKKHWSMGVYKVVVRQDETDKKNNRQRFDTWTVGTAASVVIEARQLNNQQLVKRYSALANTQ
jgi:hypothetical protein